MHKMRVHFFFFFLFFLVSFTTYSEGTKELTPSSGDDGNVQIFDNDSPSRPSATFDCPEDYRLNFTICNIGEKVYFGFKQTNDDVYFRIKDPNGNLVSINGNTINKIPNSNSDDGYINSYDEAVAGPEDIVGSSGYDALSFTPTMTGDYYIEFNPKKSGEPADFINPQKRVFTYFDITVASSANKAIPGRLWSKAWDIQCNGGSNPFNGKMYIYADDGIVTSLDFNGMQPYGFVICANSSGLSHTGDSNADRQSQNGNINYPQYRIFLNNPDEGCFPTGTFGKLTQPSKVTGCSKNNYCINVYTDRGGTIEVLLDLDAPAGYQENTRDRLILVKDAAAGANCIPWDGKDGKGVDVPFGVTINFEVNYFNGLTHLPLFDVENNKNGYIVELVRPTGPSPVLYWDDSKAGGGKNLTGCASTTGCHKWNGGDGNNKTLNTWWHAATIKEELDFSLDFIEADADISNGFGTGINDTTLCTTSSIIQLNAQVTNADGGQWTTTGSGTFSNPSDLKGTYTISPSDITKGRVSLILTTTGNGDCSPIQDSLVLNFDKKPTVSVPDISVCANNALANLNGSIANTPGVIWGGGTGIYSDKNKINPSYTPTQNEIDDGSVSLYLTASANGVCPAVTDTMTLSFTPAPTITTASTLSVCKNNPLVNLDASVTVAGGGKWSGGSGTFADPNQLKTTYTPTLSEMSTGVVLKLTTTGNNNCKKETKDVTVNFTTAPVIDAGSDQIVCANNSKVTLAGTVAGASGSKWYGGKGIFQDILNPSTTYTPDTAEITTGFVTLYLESTGNGNCLPVKDSIKITFTTAPTIDAGKDLFVCGNNPSATLKAVVTVASSVKWIGSGTFSNPNTLTTIYTPDSSDIKSGGSAIIVSTVDNGKCLPAQDTVFIVISPAPVANAGSPQAICKNNPFVKLNASTANATGQFWTGGAGSFSPSSSTLDATYTPTTDEIDAGSVTLTFVATKATCKDVSDAVQITFTNAPTAFAGFDKSVCSNNPDIALNGSVTVATEGSWATTAGGTFTPSKDVLNTTFHPDLNEIKSGKTQFILTSENNGNCLAVTDTIEVSYSPAPEAFAGNDQFICANNPNVTLSGNVQVASGGIWSGGNGTFSPSKTDLGAVYTPTQDEIDAGTVDLFLTTTDNQDCNAVTDTVTITFTPAPVANPGAAISICADNAIASLNGNVQVATGGIWSGGNGSFEDKNALITTYTPTPEEIADKTVLLTLTTTDNGKCKSVSDTIRINILPVPIANAGGDQTICGADVQVDLKGTVSNASGASWSIVSGSGTLTNATSLLASYKPSAQDKLDGAAKLKITTTGNGVCKAVEQEMTITFTVVPTINAGTDKIVCTNDLPVQLEGHGSPATWQGGAGTFSPDRNTLNAIYTPDPSEYGQTIPLTLATVANGACPTISAIVNIEIPKGPEVNAGIDQQICGNIAQINFGGTVANAPGAYWTTNGAGSISSAGTLNTSYSISSADIATGNIFFILTSNGNINCSAVQDTLFATITPPVEVHAGTDQNVCADIVGIDLAGSIKNATEATWKTLNGTGTFSDNKALSTHYTPGIGDLSLTKLQFVLESTPTATCQGYTDTVNYFITPAPTVQAGNDITVCGDTAFIVLNGTHTVAKGVGWSSNGTGSFAPDSTSDSTKYYPTPDDITKGNVRLILTTTDNGTCNPVSDTLQLTITDTPTIFAGNDTTICADANQISLNGKVTTATGGKWTTSGSGTFDNPNLLQTNYQLSSQDSINQTITLFLETTGNGSCKAVKNKLVVSLSPAPTIDAGVPQTVCADVKMIDLNGTVTVSTGGIWKTSGDGSFTIPTKLNAGYKPGSQDTIKGTVTLTITSLGNGKCKAVSDSVEINILPKPVVNAGTALTICADSNFVELNGSVLHANGGIWASKGTGNFYPKPDTVISSYVPSLDDRNNGFVQLFLTSSGNGTCNPVSDTLNISITPTPTVNPGYATTVCGDTAFIQLNGSLTVATKGVWTSSGSGVFSDSSSLNTQYVLSQDDIDAGIVLFTLTTVDHGSCKPQFATREITINPVPTVDAGTDITLCADVASIPLSGTVTIAKAGQWTTTGTGSFSPSANQLSTTYIPTPEDTTAGFVQFILTSVDNDLCNPVSDTLTVTFSPKPIVDAGQDLTICADYSGIALNGSILHASAAQWKSTGSGYFSLSPAQLDATYVPSANDKANKTVSLILTTTSMGTCNPVSDTLEMAILPAPVIDAGTDLKICADFEQVNLSPTVQHVGSGKWQTSGTGTFVPSEDSINAIYVLSPADLADKSILLTLNSTNDSLCTAVSDALVIDIDPIPSANAGFDQIICKDASTVQLAASFANAAGGEWETSGDGAFSDPNDPKATYTPSTSDKTNGSVILQFTTIGNGSCNFAEDALEIQFTDIPTVEAGADTSICAEAGSIPLSGAVTIATGGAWSSNGDGSFSPSINSLNGDYTPGTNDISNGQVILYLKSTGNGNCNAYQDSLVLNIQKVPIANAGTAFAICADTLGVSLSGIVTNASGGLWTTSSGSGTFSPSATDLNATFSPSASQIEKGKATLTLTTTGNGLCPAKSDVVVIDINPIPVVDAGPDVIVCTGYPKIEVNGFVSNASGGIWTGGTGTFTAATNLNNEYAPTVTENVAGNSIPIILTSTGNGLCRAVSDTMNISFSALPPIDAGADKTVCDSDFPVTLKGSGSVGEWVGGLGSFTPSRNSLNATYLPDATEIGTGFVKLYIQTVNNGNCAAGIDSVTITLVPGPVIEAGLPQTICANEDTVQLNGSSTAPSIFWSTDGSGSFADSSFVNSTYLFTEEDVNSGHIMLTLTAPAFGACKALTDTFSINFTPSPTISAGTDQSVCGTIPTITMDGNYTTATESGWKIIKGSGSFDDSLKTNAIYTPSPTDRADALVKLVYSTNIQGTCLSVSDTVDITFTDGPSANAGSNITICGDSSNIQLNGSVNAASGGEWSTGNGKGSFTPSPFDLNAVYQVAPEDTSNSPIALRLTTTGTGDCPTVFNEIQLSITPIPTIEADSDILSCKDVATIPIKSIYTIAGGVRWASSGTGTFDDSLSNTTLYHPSIEDKAKGSVLLNVETTNNGMCKAQADQMRINFTPAPEIEAGYPRSICENTGAVDLEATLKYAGGLLWSSPSNPAGFTDPTQAATTYTPNATDYTNKTVLLTVTSTNNGTCNAVKDTVRLSFTPAPTIDAGSPIAACADSAGFDLTGTVTVATGGMWKSSGTGTFTPSPALLNAKYIPSKADTAAKAFVLYLETTGNNGCLSVKDSLKATLVPAPVVDAGATLHFCSDVPFVGLNGTVYHSPTAIWTSQGNGIFSDPAKFNATYAPSKQDIANGGVTLKLTSTGNGNCKAYHDFVRLIIDPAVSVSVNAGFDQVLCSDATSGNLAGIVNNAGGGTWKTLDGTGTIADSTKLVTTYTFSSQDIANKKVTFVLTSTKNGFCNPVTDTMAIYLTPIPTVSAGSDTSVCGDIALVSLKGGVTISQGGKWTSSGSGSFSPNASSLTADYIPSLADVKNGKVFITLTTTGNGTCKAYSEQKQITLTPPPTISAGPDQSICSGTEKIFLKGSYTVSSGIEWATSGKGSFSSISDPQAVYMPVPEDTANKEIILTLKTINSGKCKEVSSTSKIVFTPKTVAYAGLDQIVCADIQAINLKAAVQVANGGIWTSTGNGSFSPSTTSLSTKYTPTKADRAKGSIQFTITSLGNGNCKAAIDSVQIKFAPVPTSNAGIASNCIYSAGALLNGIIGNAGGGKWISSGSGSFSPAIYDLNAIYYPSESDFNTGSVTLSLYTTGNGVCAAQYSTASFVVSDLPKADAGQTHYVCTNSETSIIATTIPNANYTWYTLSGIKIVDEQYMNPYITKDTSFVLKVVDSKGCFASDTAFVYTVNKPTLNLDDTYCLSPGLILNSNPNNLPPYPGTFSWFKNESLISGRATPQISINDAGKYQVTYTVGSCITIDSAEVVQPPVLISPSKVVCSNMPITIATSNYPGYSYKWTSSQGAIGFGSTTTIYSLPDTTKYNVLVTDTKGCSSKDSMYVISIPAPDPKLSDTAVCEGIEVLLDGTAKTSNNTPYAFSYLWTKDNKPLATTASYLAKEAGTYKIEITIESCTSEHTAKITYMPGIKPFLPEKIYACTYGKDTVLDAKVVGGYGNQYLWNTGETTSSIEVSKPGLYSVYIKNGFNCALTDSTEIISNCPPRVFIPTAFYPDGKEIDQHFLIFGTDFKDFTITVFSRWGEIIFFSSDPKKGWDGTYRGKMMPTGVYPYVIKYKSSVNGKDYVESGKVTLMR